MRRNRGRFPPDFVLELTAPEWESLRSQIVILKTGRGRHRKFLPVAFTEHGAVMAATILNSPQAVQMSILVVRAFIAMRSALQDSKQLAAKLDALEKSLAISIPNTLILSPDRRLSRQRRRIGETNGQLLSAQFGRGI
jgi:hypothetical protein